MAVIDNQEYGVVVSGTSGDDSIRNVQAYDVTIDGGKGDDSITNGDVWTVYQKSYLVTHSGDNISINANAGNDSILNGGNNVTIRGGAGDDWIFNNGSNVTIDGGKGNDSIQNVTSSNATINGVSKAFNVLFVYNGGNDYIEGFDNTSALKIASGELDSVFNTNGSDYFITVGENVITLVGAAALEKVNIVTGKNKTVKFNVNANIIGTEGTDTIYNYIDGATINAGAGNDSIRNNYSNVSINAGTDNDTIRNYASDVTIDGGKGDDYILNDFIYNKYGENVLFVYSGGNDTIDGLNASSTLQIASGKMNSVVQSNGSDYFLTVGKNFVTLKGAAYRDKVNIVDAKGKAIDFTVKDITVKNEKDKRTLRGTADRDDIENRGNKVTIISANGDDTIWNNGENVSITAGDGGDSIKNSGGNYDSLTNGDNVTIDGGKGNDTIQNGGGIGFAMNTRGGDNVLIRGGSGNDYIFSMKASNVTIDGGSGNDFIDNSGAKVTIDAGAGDDTISSYGNNNTISTGAGNDSVYLGGDVNVYVYSAGNDTLYNFNDLDSIVLGSVKVNSSVRADSTVTLNLSNKKILRLENYRSEKINVVKSLADVEDVNVINNYDSSVTVKGTTRKDYILNGTYASDVTISAGAGDDSINNNGSRVIIEAGAGDDSIDNNGSRVIIEAGSGDDSIANNYGHYSLINAGKGNDTIYNNGSQVTIEAGDGNDTIHSNGSQVIIDAGTGNDSIYNYSYEHYSSINAGAGDDYISNDGGAHVTIDGGIGNDIISLRQIGYLASSLNVIQYVEGDGNDSITGFNFNDTLQIAASKYSTKTSGDDIVVTVGDGKITLAGAASLSSINIDFSKLLLVDDKTSSPVTVETDVKVIDGTKRTRAVKITGNALNNSIVGGSDKDTLKGRGGNDSLFGGSGADKIYGEAGSDTLWGGAGNDTLYGGEGDDVFIYRADEGKDTIMDFTSGDMLQILNADGSEGTFTNSSFKSGKLTLAIEGGGHVVFSGVNTSDTFNINGTTYKISGKKLI
ncbi:MAG: hypothetical protein IJG80_08545 [Selenomonadaceae bacterium]|nr:hypothetical protein [Selenomonadaceae bacterium]